MILVCQAVRLYEPDLKHDGSSFANINEVRMTHISMDLQIDFTNRVLFGFVDLSFKPVNGSFAHVVLDSKDLDISKIEGNGTTLEYSVDKGHSQLGEAIKVVIPEDMKKGEFTIRVTYTTG